MKNLTKTKFVLITALSITFFIGVFSSNIFAEKLGGKSGQYAVYFEISSQVSSSYTSEIKDAAVNWNGIADIALRYRPDWQNVYDYYIYNDIDVQYMANDAYWTSQGYYGFGIPGPDGNSGTYTYGDLYIVNGNCKNLSSHDKEMVITHEFGHLLGLAHTEDGVFSAVNSIMDEGDVFDNEINGPTGYDEEELRDLYPY